MSVYVRLWYTEMAPFGAIFCVTVRKQQFHAAIVQRPPAHTLFLNASKRAVGDSFETGWSRDISAGERGRLCGTSCDVRFVDGILINVTEEVGIIILAHMLVVVRRTLLRICATVACRGWDATASGRRAWMGRR